MGQGTGWTGQYALQAIAGKITGLCTRINIGCANTKTISIEEDGNPEGIWRVSAKLLKKTGPEQEKEVEFAEADDVTIVDEEVEKDTGVEELARKSGIFPEARHGY